MLTGNCIPLINVFSVTMVHMYLVHMCLHVHEEVFQKANTSLESQNIL